MEVSGVVLRNVTCPSFSMHVSSRGGGGSCVMVPVRMREKAVVRCCCGFSDSGHVQYYGDEKKEQGTTMLSAKKKLKMLKKRVLFDNLQGNLTSLSVPITTAEFAVMKTACSREGIKTMTIMSFCMLIVPESIRTKVSITIRIERKEDRTREVERMNEENKNLSSMIELIQQ
ncbi:hypothetical protein HN51_066508, partial [Arachis hypogaea]